MLFKKIQMFLQILFVSVVVCYNCIMNRILCGFVRELRRKSPVRIGTAYSASPFCGKFKIYFCCRVFSMRVYPEKCV